MKAFKLLLDAGCADAVGSIGSVLGAETSLIDSQPVRRSANLRIFQIDVPEVPARVLAETARRAGVSTETLLMDRIAQRGAEIAAGVRGGDRILSKCRRIADWCGLGTTDQPDRIAALAEKLARD